MAEKVILITGASSGIGRAIAEYLSQQGYSVFGTSRRPDAAQSYPFTMLTLDVTRVESIQTCVQEVIAQAGRIDVLINNAGIVGMLAASEETTPEDWQNVFRTNFFGIVNMTNTVLTIMRQQCGGRIIHISSAAGFIAMPPYTSIYAASKHALEGYSEALRYELHPFNIQSSTVQLGYIQSNIGQSIAKPKNSLAVYEATRQRVYEADLYAVEHGGDPLQIARTVAHIITTAHPKPRYRATSDSNLLYYLKQLLPSSWMERFLRYAFLEGQWDAKNPDFLRRALLDTAFAQRLQVNLAVVLLIVFGIIGFLWLMPRLT